MMMNARQTNRLLRRVGIGGLLVAALAFLLPVAASAQSEVDDPALLEAGEEIYVESCAGCHGTEGEGSDFGRPLTGIADQQPDRLVHITSVTDGKGGMPAFGGSLSDEEIDAAVTYARLTFVAERSVDELPNTGTSPIFFMAAGFLILTGIALNETARRQRFSTN